MKSDSEEGEIARVSGSDVQSDDQDDQDHLEIKPPQHQYTERDHHRSKHHEYRSRTGAEKRTSDSKSDRRHQNKRRRYSREREREGPSHGDHERRRDSKRKESSRQSHDRRDRRSDRDEKYKERESSEKSSVRDAREKLVKRRAETKDKPNNLESGDEELRRRRERLLANYHEHEREKREKEKERLKEKSTQERELPASYKFDTEEDGEKAKPSDKVKDSESKEPQKKAAAGSDNSRDTSGSEESSGSEDEEEEDDSGDDTAEGDNSAASTGERKARSDDERTKSSPNNVIDVDRSSNNGVHHNDKDDDDDDDRDAGAKRGRERDVREEDEFLENRPARDKDEDSQDARDSDKLDEDDEVDLIDYLPGVQGCRRVEEFHCLNRIEEGTYGVVYRAKDKLTNEVVALKRLKMENEKEGFPITSLREINTLMKAQHPNIVTVREIVVGSNMDKIYIVMDYVEHDLKSLMETMKAPFLVGEVKTLMMQLLRAVAHMHDNWILHRDLKTSNLLLSHKGVLKVGDFGLAREYGSPLKQYTPIVVTLWYRAPELLLGSKEYSCPIDVWSVGCIFGELLTMGPLFPGKSEVDELNKIFKALGTPSEKIWPGYNELPMVKKFSFEHQPYNLLRKKITETMLTEAGFELLNKLLTYCPQKRITAEDALHHEWFEESPEPIDPEMFPTWPAKSEGGNRKAHSPKPPAGGQQYAMQNLMQNDLFPSRFMGSRNAVLNTP